MMDNRLRVTVDLATPKFVAKYAEIIEGALALANLYRNALAAVPWPSICNQADYEAKGNGWNRPVALDQWEREWEDVRLKALQESAEQLAEYEALRAKWDAIPWEVIEYAAERAGSDTLYAWLNQYMPKEPHA